MQQIFSVIRQVAPTSAPVLICGETGTGKELVAREIHKLSPRSDGPFVAGSFEQAHGGTLFRDEIGEMPPSTQPKLLRALEDLRVKRLGGKSEISVNVRVLAATIHSLKERLREELYYRLSVFQIALPPLRERKEDIPLIAEVMIQTLNEKHGACVSGLDSEVLDLFRTYDWPGNVRELHNVIERATIVASAGILRLEHLPSPAFGSRPRRKTSQASGHESPMMLQPGQPLTQLEGAYISLTLDHVRGNRKRAAEMLGGSDAGLLIGSKRHSSAILVPIAVRRLRLGTATAEEQADGPKVERMTALAKQSIVMSTATML